MKSPTSPPLSSYVAAQPQHRLFADRGGHLHRVAEIEVVVLGPVLLQRDVAVTEGRQHIGRPLVDLHVPDLVERGRVDPASERLAADPVDLGLGRVQRRDGLHAGDSLQGVAGLRADRREPVLVQHHDLSLHVLADRVVDRRLHAVREDGHERHQRKPDHQCRGRDGRAARVAERVLAREATGHAAQPLERIADGGGDRRHQPRAQQRHCDEDEDRPDPQQAERLTGRAARRRARAGRQPLRR